MPKIMSVNFPKHLMVFFRVFFAGKRSILNNLAFLMKKSLKEVYYKEYAI